jgi:hypothetical protein
MDSEKTPHDTLEAVTRLEAAFHAELASRKRAKRAANIVSLLLGCIIFFFAVFNFIHFRSDWTDENFRSSVEKELKELSPLALRELNALGRELLPVYANETKEQFTLLLPQISGTVEKELDALCAEVLSRTHRRLEECEERVLSRTEEVIFESYPALRDAGKREELAQRFKRVTDTAVLSVMQEFDRLFSKDIADVRAMLLKFDLKDSGESTVDLQKNFLRLWLRLLDQEIQEL